MSLEEIKVQRTSVLDIVKENKKKHDTIFADAVDGYWLEAVKFLKKFEKDTISNIEKTHKEQLKKMRKCLRDNKRTIKDQVKKELDLVDKKKKDGPWVYMRNAYPENHADDYIGTIRRLELCVDAEVVLDVNEFDKYIRNKWEWRTSFLNINTCYANTARGNVGLGTTTPNSILHVSGNSFGTGSYADVAWILPESHTCSDATGDVSITNEDIDTF